MKPLTLTILVALVALVGCTPPPQTPTSPTPVVIADTTAGIGEVPIGRPGQIIIVPPSPPIAADPPVTPPIPVPCRHISPVDVVWKGPYLVEIPAGCADQWRAERVDIASGELNGWEQITLPAGQRGTLTIGGAMRCGRTYQVDVWKGGSSQMFAAAGIVYRGEACPPPPPPPVCVVQPAGPCGEWITASSGQPATCQPVRQQRSCPRTCGAAPVIESRTLTCPS